MQRRHIDLLILSIIVLAVLFYDLTLELLTQAADLFFELLFEGVEWFELGIEHLVEYLFHTEHHTSQIVTFYILLLIGVWMARWLWRVLPGWFLHCRQMAQQAWVRRITEIEIFWLTMALRNRLLLIAAALGVAFLASFFAI
jgi:hypothetical protein